MLRMGAAVGIGRGGKAMHEPKEIQVRQAVGAAVIGNVLEWYDFAVYAYFAGVIGKNFFPSDNEITSLLATFAVFGVGFAIPQ